ncbi:MAG TPA: HAD-IA family hydrolase [Spongiibacteraceae bacterium]|nr:HAD-IA family hydrolase [Spongiibacteraceae bacterium]
MLFIFDWDGTLIDSTGHIIGAMQEAARELRLPVLSSASVQNIIGLGLPEAILALYPELDEAARHELKLGYAKHYIALNEEPPELFAGVADTLDRLKSEGHSLAVATGKNRRGLQRVLGQLDMLDYFHATRCADEAQSKPHPQMLHELLAELAMPAEQAVMIGDTEYDMAMAREAGMARIGVDYGAHEVERLLRYAPDLILSDFPALLGWQGLQPGLK